MPEARLVFLHGFTQSHHHWHECAHLIAACLPAGASLTFIDLPGHGLSADDRLTVEQAASELVDLAGPGTYVGYSMGARHALTAACGDSPEIERLVLVGGTPGIDDTAERAARIADDESRADRIIEIGSERFVDEWLAQPLFDGLTVTADDRRHRLGNTAEGMASSLRLAGTGAQRPLWSELGDVGVPVLVLAGDHDAKFTATGERMAAMMRHAEFAAIQGAGHAAHTEQPVATARLIADWITRAPARS